MEIQEVKEGNIPAPAEAPSAPEPVVTPTPEAAPTAPSEEKLDYQALYEREKEKLAKAEFTLYKKNKESRAKRTQGEPVAEEFTSEAEPVVDHEKIKKMVEEEAYSLLEAQRAKDAEDIIEEEMRSLTSNEDEQRLVRLMYDNRLTKTGYSRLAIRDDLKQAWFLANRPKFLKEQQELVKTATQKQTVTSTPLGASVEKASQPTDDLSKHFSGYDWNWMKRRGWSDEMIKKALQNKQP